MAIVWLVGSSDAVKTVYTAARILRVSELYTMFQNKIPEGSRHSFLKFFSRSEKKDGGVAIPPGGQRMYVWPLWGCEIKAGEVGTREEHYPDEYPGSRLEPSTPRIKQCSHGRSIS